MTVPAVRRRTLAATLSLAVAMAAASLIAPVAAQAADDPLPEPLPGTNPIVVSVGDSYISGEAGRWAGNSLNALTSDYTDVGEDAYNDTATGESIPKCHRSKDSAIHFDTLAPLFPTSADVTPVNLACSGATTGTAWSDSLFKPGIDFYDYADGATHYRGQALELERLARVNGKRIKMVVLSIGGNDFEFETVVKTCLAHWAIAGTPCSDLGPIRALFEGRNVAAQREHIRTAVVNLNTAMQRAGYDETEWTLVVQNYPSPIPGDKALNRYPELGPERQAIGGCGMYDKDLHWANEKALGTINQTVVAAANDAGMSNVRFLDLSGALVGRRLCEVGVNMVGKSGLLPRDWFPVKWWTQRRPEAVNGSEWVSQIRVPLDPYELQEFFHPNYWGHRAYQVCYHAIWNDGAPMSGTCARDGDNVLATAEGVHPSMTLLLTTPGTSVVNGNPDAWVYTTPAVEESDAGAGTGTGAGAPSPEPPQPAPTVTETTPGPTTIVSLVPGQVGSLSARSAKKRTVKVTWTAPTEPAAQWYEYRYKKSSGWTGWKSTTKRSVTIKDLKSGKTIKIQVRAGNDNGTGPIENASTRVK